MRNTLLFKEERCSRPLYSSHTPHPADTNTTTVTFVSIRATRTTTHTPRNPNESHHSVRAPCAAPDTQQRTNASDKNRLIASHVRHPHHESCVSPGGILTPRVRVHLDIFHNIRVCSTTHGHSTTQLAPQLQLQPSCQPKNSKAP